MKKKRRGLVRRFYLQPHLSPTDHNLSHYLLMQGWKVSPFRWLANFSDKHLHYHQEAAQTLEYKHLLANLVASYCPDVMPLTFCINDNNWLGVLSQLDDRFYHGKRGAVSDLVWILKPALLNNGQSIKIFQTLTALEQHFLQTNRLGGEHVLQEYLYYPHLLRDNRKYSLRQFVVLTNYSGAYCYRQGYCNVALNPFEQTDFSDLRPHLTNEHLYGNEPNVIQIPTDKFVWYDEVFRQIQVILAKVIAGLQQCFPDAFLVKKQKTFALFGVDFMVDKQGRVWLLEFNHGPCFPTEPNHPLQAYLYDDFWKVIIKQFVMPIAHGLIPNEQHQDFIAIPLENKK